MLNLIPNIIPDKIHEYFQGTGGNSTWLIYPIGCIKTRTKRKNSCPYSLFSPVLMSGSKPSSKYIKKIPNISNPVKGNCRSQTGCNRGLHRSRSFP